MLFNDGDDDMPPKTDLTQEKIERAGFELIREQGFDSLTARGVAQRLQCSTQPIYSLYSNIEELKSRVYDKVIAFALSCMGAYQDSRNSPALNGAIGFLRFAKEEKQLFRTLYQSGYKKYDTRSDFFIVEELCLASMRHSKRLSGIPQEQLRSIFLKLNIYMIGIGTLLSSNTLELDITEATDMIREMYEMLLGKEGLTN